MISVIQTRNRTRLADIIIKQLNILLMKNTVE